MKYYVDPSTYEDPCQAIREFAREVDPTYMKIEEVIGAGMAEAEGGYGRGPSSVPPKQGRTLSPSWRPPQPTPALPGSFGEVRRGRLQPRGRREQAVAIQALWSGGAESLQMAFLGQAAVLGQFQHPNVLRLEGVVTKSRPLMVVTELMELGPLDSFLRVSQAGSKVWGAARAGKVGSSQLSGRQSRVYAFTPLLPHLQGLRPSFPDRSLIPRSLCLLVPVSVRDVPRSPTPRLTSAPPIPQQREGQFSSLQLVAMQRGVAAAMHYLSSFAFVHRALSAHSVLVNSHLVCKVARLGHSPQVRAQPWGPASLRGRRRLSWNWGGGCLRWCILASEGAELTCGMEGFQGLRTLGTKGDWEGGSPRTTSFLPFPHAD